MSALPWPPAAAARAVALGLKSHPLISGSYLSGKVLDITLLPLKLINTKPATPSIGVRWGTLPTNRPVRDRSLCDFPPSSLRSPSPPGGAWTLPCLAPTPARKHQERANGVEMSV